MGRRKINPYLDIVDMYIVNQHNQILDKFLITITPTALFTVGIQLNFASGTLTIDWNDGSPPENFVSGVELTHQYVSASTYISELSGDLTNITAFIADNSRITSISGLQTGLLTNFQIQNNLYVGILDLSNAPVSNDFFMYGNPGLTGVTFATSGNTIVDNLQIYSCGLTGTLDLSNVPIKTRIRCYLNANLTGITFASSGNEIVTDFLFYQCDITGILDLSNIPISTTFQGFLNSNLTGITFASSGNGQMTGFRVELCNITGTFDLSSLTFSNQFQIRGNSNLTGISFAGSGHGTLSTFFIYNCDLPNIDFSIFGISNGINIDMDNNSLTATEHDNQLINIDTTGWINGALDILTGNTARTSASDTAHNNLIANGWTIT